MAKSSRRSPSPNRLSAGDISRSVGAAPREGGAAVRPVSSLPAFVKACSPSHSSNLLQAASLVGSAPAFLSAAPQHLALTAGIGLDSGLAGPDPGIAKKPIAPKPCEPLSPASTDVSGEDLGKIEELLNACFASLEHSVASFREEHYAAANDIFQLQRLVVDQQQGNRAALEDLSARFQSIEAKLHFGNSVQARTRKPSTRPAGDPGADDEEQADRKGSKDHKEPKMLKEKNSGGGLADDKWNDVVLSLKPRMSVLEYPGADYPGAAAAEGEVGECAGQLICGHMKSGQSWRSLKSGAPARPSRMEATSSGTQPSSPQYIKGAKAEGRCAFRLKCLELGLDRLAMVVILCNCVFMGFGVDASLSARWRGEEVPSWVWIGDLSFTVLFIVEVALRLTIVKRDFWRGPERCWNLFDVIVMCSAILEVLVGGINLTFLRSLKISSVVRAMRIMRTVRLFRELRFMVASIISSLLSLFWAVVLLIFFVYISAICMLQTLETPQVDALSMEVLPDKLQEFYGSVHKAMLTLFMAVSGGCEWRTLLQPLRSISEWYVVLFVLYVVFAFFGSVHIMTGVFVQATQRFGEVDKALRIQDTSDLEANTSSTLRRMLYEYMGEDKSAVTCPELQAILDDRVIRATLKSVGIGALDARGLFVALGCEGQETIDVEQCVAGMMRMQFSASEVDVAALAAQNKKIMIGLSSFMDYAEEQFKKLSDLFDDRSSRGCVD